MKLGVALPYASARSIAELCRMAEDSGWDGCFIGDAVWCEDPMIALAAAAMVTERVRLGTAVLAVPLHRPWRIASESVALDRLSNGRLILGLGTGAVWMGWQAFPDEVTETRARAEMLDESIDVLTRLYQRQPFDYDGKHFHLRLTQLDQMHYPPAPAQQPRVPLWVPGIWPRPKSMRRVLKCDGVLLEKHNAEGQPVEVTPADARAVREFVRAGRTLTTPFDIVIQGKLAYLDAAQQAATLHEWHEAGATWWIESMYDATEADCAELLKAGPPAHI